MIAESFVPAHTKILKDKKIIAFRPKYSKFERGPKIFRILSEEPEREGQFFLTRSIKDNLIYFKDDLAFEINKAKGLRAQ